MDITFKCPNCEQELEVDASGAGSDIECPACSKTITVPIPEPVEAAAGGATGVATEMWNKPPAAPPPKEEKHFAVPVHDHAPEALIQKPTARPLVVAKEGDKTLRIKTIKRTDCQEVGKDHFDEKVSEFLEKVGHTNIVSINTINYSYVDISSRQLLTDYGVLVVFKG